MTNHGRDFGPDGFSAWTRSVPPIFRYMRASRSTFFQRGTEEKMAPTLYLVFGVKLD